MLHVGVAGAARQLMALVRTQASCQDRPFLTQRIHASVGAPPSFSISRCCLFSKRRLRRERSLGGLFPFAKNGQPQALFPVLRRSCNTPQSAPTNDRRTDLLFDRPVYTDAPLQNCWIEILPSARCWRIPCRSSSESERSGIRIFRSLLELAQFPAARSLVAAVAAAPVLSDLQERFANPG